MQPARNSDGEYFGYVFAALGCAFTVAGAVALYALQQGTLLKTKYTASFQPLLFMGVAIAVLGLAVLVWSRRKNKFEIPPPPFAEPPPPPPT